MALDHPAILSFPQGLVEEDCLERNCGSCKNHHQEHEGQHHPIWPHEDSLQESYNAPRYRTPNRQSPYPTMKGFPLQPVGKSLGVCSKGVLKQPWILMATQPMVIISPDHKGPRLFLGGGYVGGGVWLNSCPKNPWDAMGCQVATCFEALFRESLGGSGVSIRGFRILRVLRKD